MTKPEALKLIDDHKNGLINPVEMLNWTWLRLILSKIPEDEWEKHVVEACEMMSR